MPENTTEKKEITKPDVKKVISPTAGRRITEGAKPNNNKKREKVVEYDK